MIIVRMTGGLGNQLFQYAAGRRLAHKWNTELKIDISAYKKTSWPNYVLDSFNVKDLIANSEEIERIANLTPNNSFGKETNSQTFMPEFFNYPDDVYLRGCWESERYFADIADIIRQEFTLKVHLSETAERWKEKILSTENSVSLHVRHGDFAYSPRFSSFFLFALLPLDYYYECIKQLRQQYKNLTVFIFSNDLIWCKKNFHLDMPTEFVEGEGLKDFEELHLMSLCKHNIIANSTFSWWGAWLNQNPDKKVFVPMPSFFFGKNMHYRFFLPERNENSLFQSDRWIKIPFDVNAQFVGTMNPWFSLLVVVNNDAATLVESLNSLLGQDYKYFELIIIDNASIDDSSNICRQVVKTFDNVTLIKLHDKVSNGAAWNIALKAAQSQYVLFLKGNDRLLANALTNIYLANENIFADVVNLTAHLKEDERGDIVLADKKFVLNKMTPFQNLNGIFRDKLDKSTLLRILASDEIIFPIGTRLFKRKFLEENKIRFNEKIGDDAEKLFVLDALFQTNEIIFSSQVAYIAPYK